MSYPVNQKDFEDRTAQAHFITTNYTIASNVAAFIPVTGLDMVALMGIQLKMLHSLSKLYHVPYSENLGKSLISSLLGGMFFTRASMTIASLLKSVPGIGTLSGWVGMLTTASASTYAIGKVFTQHFESGGSFLNFDPQAMRKHFEAEFERSQSLVGEMVMSKESFLLPYSDKKTNEHPPTVEQDSSQSPKTLGHHDRSISSETFSEEKHEPILDPQEEHVESISKENTTQDDKNSILTSVEQLSSGKESDSKPKLLSSDSSETKDTSSLSLHSSAVNGSSLSQQEQKLSSEHSSEEVHTQINSVPLAQEVPLQDKQDTTQIIPSLRDQESPDQSHPSQEESISTEESEKKHGSLFSFYKDRKKKHH